MPLAIHRARMHFTETTADLNSIRLRSGDVLLVQGTQKSLNELKSTGTMLVLDGTLDIPHTHRAPRAVAIMLLVVLAAAMRLLPISRERRGRRWPDGADELPDLARCRAGPSAPPSC